MWAGITDQYRISIAQTEIFKANPSPQVDTFNSAFANDYDDFKCVSRKRTRTRIESRNRFSSIQGRAHAPDIIIIIIRRTGIPRITQEVQAPVSMYYPNTVCYSILICQRFSVKCTPPQRMGNARNQ